MPPGVPDYYNGQMMRPGPLPPGATVNGGGGEHALQDYQMQLMLLEQQNKKRLLMARQEQDGPGQPGMSFPANGMSPQGSRGGPSPGPGAERRGTPKLGQQSMDGSPLPDGSMRGSPAAMQNFNQAQPPELYNSINPGVRPPPSSNPAFVAAQFPQQQMEQMRRMPNGNWQQGPQAHAAMPQQATNPQQPPQMGTPQQRNEMPPPQAPTAPTANGRTGSDEAPPTPQPTNKANPKPKKDTKKVNLLTRITRHGMLTIYQKGEGKGKKNAGSVAATPASEAENPPPTPTPSTPITPSHPQSFGQKESLQGNPNPSTNGAATQQMQPPQQDVMSTATFDPNVHNASDVSLNLSVQDMVTNQHRAMPSVERSTIKCKVQTYWTISISRNSWIRTPSIWKCCKMIRSRPLRSMSESIDRSQQSHYHTNLKSSAKRNMG